MKHASVFQPSPGLAGLGLRRALIDALLAAPAGEVDFLELAPENWLGMGGSCHRRFDALAERYSLMCHGLSLSLGGAAHSPAVRRAWRALQAGILYLLIPLAAAASPPWQHWQQQTLDHYQHGRLQQATASARQALRYARRPPHDPHALALSLNNLGLMYKLQGQSARAERLFRQALPLVEASQGPHHPDTAGCLNNLATLLHAQQRHTEAEPLLLRVLAIREAALGPDHPDVALSLNNLGSHYFATGHPDQAEPLLQRALAIRRRTLPANHPDIARSEANLAALHRQRAGQPEKSAP